MPDHDVVRTRSACLLNLIVVAPRFLTWIR